MRAVIKKATPSIILASFLVGIIVGVALRSWLQAAEIWVAVIVVVDAAFILFRRAAWRDRLLLIVLVVLGIVSGVLRYDAALPGAHSVAAVVGEQRLIRGVVEEREGGVTSQQITLRSLSVDEAAVAGKILVFSPGYPKIATGDTVSFSCDLEKPEPFEGFAYDRYLATKNIYATCFVREVPFVVSTLTVAQRPLLVLDRVHEGVVAVIDRTFGEPQSALLAGLLMGDDNFSDEWKERFLRTGTSHVVAASGSNVSMLAFVLMALLISLGFRRQYAFPIIVVGILGFVFIAGAEAAVTRAGIMGILALSATQLGRKTTPRNLLLLTVAIMLLIEPRLLRDDAGFQLSVLSTVGLVTMSKYFSEKFAFMPEFLGIREAFATTIAATLATLPITIGNFGALSVISPFVNLLVLPFIPYAMLAGTVAVIVGMLNQAVGALVAGPAWLLLSLMLEIIQAMASLPFASLNIPI
ncbi:MAG: competence protein ComEC [Patescibacteria group bacterium]|nr:competence protein ComEC [Patescibacteria group bacterium]